jgi:ATP-dependent DNA helicase RecG
VGAVRPGKVQDQAAPKTAPRSVVESASAPAKINGVPPSLLPKLAKLGLQRRFDLVLHLPLRYEDETTLSTVAAAQAGAPVQLELTVLEADIRYRPRRTLLVSAGDDTGVVVLRFLSFYGSQVKQFTPGKKIRVFGEVREGYLGRELVHPRYRIVTPGSPLPQVLTPVYPTTAGLSQAQLRKFIEIALEQEALTETLPDELIKREQLLPFRDAVLSLHHPAPDARLAELAERTHPAWRRVKFDELLAQQLSLRHAHRERRKRSAVALPRKAPRVASLLKALPFRLTLAQQRVWAEISRDLATPHPMQRLLQGDVGSGKTVIAALAALQAIDAGCQAAFMAPTEILAEQHYRKLCTWLGPLGIRIARLSGSMKKKDKLAASAALESGEAELAVGTHALIEDNVEFARLALAIVDEQHRFGVSQRVKLRQKGISLHQLMMSATPIPRTLSMSYYADLDISVLDELPPGRQPVTTKLAADTRRDEVVRRVREACMAGRQAYWICPLIEESEKLQLKTAIETHAVIAATFPELKVGLLHGRQASAEKAAVMQEFVAGSVQVLVATTVIEVGVDVPNASLMIIEHAERFGLSQLHQLRGRVGRGADDSVCVLLYQSPLSEAARARLKAVFECQDGFEIARLDLHLRGPGEFLGSRQSGAPLLRFANLETDGALVEAASRAADELLDHEPQRAALHVARWMGARAAYLRT